MSKRIYPRPYHLWWMVGVIGLISLIITYKEIARENQNQPQTDIITETAPVLAQSNVFQPYYESLGDTSVEPEPYYEALDDNEVMHYALLESNPPEYMSLDDTAIMQPEATPLPLVGPESYYQPLFTPDVSLAVKPILRTQVTPTPPMVTHQVKSGEILASIALEYGVTTESILMANQLPQAPRLQVGQRLNIPLKVTSEPIELHEAKTGETLLSIAAKYRSSVGDILRYNPHLKPEALTAGQLITVPIVFPLEPTPSPVGSPTPTYHIVQAGEAPLIIADKYHTSVELLLAINEIIDPFRLRIGTKLRIPPPDGLSLSVPIVVHELSPGETLLGIVAKYGSSVRDVLYTNPDFIPASLEPGKLIAVPVIFPSTRPIPRPTRQPRWQIPPPAHQPKLAAQMVEAMNETRVANGLPPLTTDDQLTSVAIQHAQDMVMRNFFGHVSPEGKTLRHRLTENGFPPLLKAGENIQRNKQSANETVEVAVRWLMNSKPHRNNILHTDYHQVGIGIVESQGIYTIVTDFSE